MKHQKGFTLIELLVTLGLAGIIISIVMSFFIANLKSYETINVESELQYQSQYIINYMTNKILESKAIVLVNIDDLDKTVETDISNISFQYGNANQCHNFKVNSNNEILYKNGAKDDPVDQVFGNYVVNLMITPISDPFKDTKSIEIYLKLKNGSKSYEARQIIHMRNSK